MKQKRIPMRMCVGCHEMKPKKELIRIVKNKQDEIDVDFTGKKHGRGAYICRHASCFEKAVKGKKLVKAFEIPISEDVYNILRQQLEDDDNR